MFGFAKRKDFNALAMAHNNLRDEHETLAAMLISLGARVDELSKRKPHAAKKPETKPKEVTTD